MKIFEKIKEHLPFKKNNENSANKKNKKQEKKKSKLKIFINVLSYIFGGIFLIVLLFSCVNSCKGNNEDNKKSLNDIQHRANDLPNNLIDTTWTFNSPITFQNINFEGMSNGFVDITFNFTSYNKNWTYLRYVNKTNDKWLEIANNLGNGVVLFEGDNTNILNSNYSQFTITGFTGDTIENNLRLFLSNFCTQYGVTPEPETSVEPSVEPSNDNSIVDSEYNIIDTIVFNNAFDWRILFSGGYQKNTGLFFLNRDYAVANPVVHFTGMEFVSDGVLYNTIDITLIVCDNASVVYTGYNDEGKQIEYVVNTSNLFSYNNDKSLCAIGGVFYRYYNGSVDNLQNVTNQVHVYNGTQINYVAPSSEGASTYVQSVNYNIHEWLSNSYKKLLIVSASNEGANSLYPNISTYELITNNENLVITEYGELGDVFSLLGGGFTALTSVFGIYILPNISIGVLIFLPLVVVMFITIIRLIKK